MYENVELKKLLEFRIKNIEKAAEKKINCPFLTVDVLPLFRLLADMVIELDEKLHAGD